MSGTREPVGPPPNEDVREATEAVARATAGLVPIAGAPLAELVGVLVDKAIPRRREAWLRKLGEAVDYLQAHAVDIAGLGDNEAFVSVLQEATEAATKTAEEDKLRALRNAVTRSALAIGPDEHTQMTFVRYVGELTPLHLQVLAYLRDPASWFDGHAIPRPNIYMGSRSALLEAAFRQLQRRREFYDQVLHDLESRGLAHGAASMGTMVTQNGLWQALIRPAGEQFLEFVSDPPER